MGRAIQYHVNLSVDEREKLEKHLRSRKHSLESKKRAQVLLDLDESQGNHPPKAKQIAAKRGVSDGAIVVLRRKYAQGGLDEALYRKKRDIPPVLPKVTGDVQAHIIAVCCSEPPKGKSRWTVAMVADKIVANGVIDSISDESVRQVLKKTNSSRT